MVNWESGAVPSPTGAGVTPDNHREAHVRAAANIAQMRRLFDAREATRVKTPVRVASTANVSAAALVPGATFEGVTLAAGDRVLLKNQTNGAENGIVDVNASGAPTRSTDADTPVELSGAVVAVMEGAQAGRMFTQVETLPTLGSTALIWLRTTFTVSVTQAEYDALPSSLKQAGSAIIFAVVTG